MTVEDLLIASKEELPEAAVALQPSDLPQLIALLSEKNDNIRYQAFLALQYRSRSLDDVYPYWERFRSKLTSDNSYQRSIGLMLIAENVRWDTQGRMEATIDAFLECLNDEKPITVRQCIQSLPIIHRYQPRLDETITARLTAIDLMKIRETMRKPILMDALQVLAAIRKEHPSETMDRFFTDALTGGILDAKSKKQIQALL
ncbi:MAG: hypothetical protein GX418_14395 [Clostridiales bacterium]|nr:hypothetical protein [Clostridiales bacterium]